MGKLLAIANRQKSGSPMNLFDFAQVSLSSGVNGDFRGKPGKRQVTVVSRESWDHAIAELGKEVDWTARRANLLVEGIDLQNSKGHQLRIGSVLLEISGETEPCENMDAQCQGLRSVLQPEWRGGVLCSVLEEGHVAIGDPVSLIEA